VFCVGLVIFGQTFVIYTSGLGGWIPYEVLVNLTMLPPYRRCIHEMSNAQQSTNQAKCSKQLQCVIHYKARIYNNLYTNNIL